MIGINTAFQMLTSRRPSAPDGGAGAVTGGHISGMRSRTISKKKKQ